jgi:hypothetical protein
LSRPCRWSASERAGRASCSRWDDPSVGRIDADERKVRRLFNLLSNAVKLHRSSNGHARAAATRTRSRCSPRPAGDRPRGPGVDLLSSTSRQARHRGTGLGLASRSAWSSCTAVATVDSAIGVGSTFTVTLPRRRPAEPWTRPVLPAALSTPPGLADETVPR